MLEVSTNKLEKKLLREDCETWLLFENFPSVIPGREKKVLLSNLAGWMSAAWKKSGILLRSAASSTFVRSLGVLGVPNVGKGGGGGVELGGRNRALRGF